MNKYTTTSTESTIVNGSPITVLQIEADPAQPVWVTGYEVSFNGITSTDVPCRVQILRQTDVGTGGSTTTPAPHDNRHPAATAVVNTYLTGAADSFIIKEFYLSPNGGTYARDLGTEDAIFVGVGERLGIKISVPTSAVNTIVSITHGE